MRPFCQLGHRQPRSFGITRSVCRALSSSPLRRIPKRRLPSTPARTRFAPSPTGFLHLGSLRTALFNYLLAKKTGGEFILRLEDTDRKRTVHGAEERLYQDLKWAGLQWDEGPNSGGAHGPYRQSERSDIYREHAIQLLKTPHAYRCFCSPERLSQLAKQREQLGLPSDYDRTCESLSEIESEQRAGLGQSFVVRLRAPDTYPTFNDAVYGEVGRASIGSNTGVTHKHGEVVYEDPILLKSDGNPTYHFANVVDDHAMHITHVLRATEWLSSTPKHLALYKAFGWTPPEYAHVGLLTDAEGQKLSKRKGDTTLDSFRRAGALPDALVNFAALLGWSHSRKNDVMDLQELAREFQMKFTKGNATVTFDKLAYLQRAHAARAATSAETSATFVTMLDNSTEHAMGVVNASEEMDSFLLVEPGQIRHRMSLLLQHDARSYESPMQFYNRNRYFFERLPPISLEGSPVAEDSDATVQLLAMASTLCANGADQLRWDFQVLDAHLRNICRLETHVTAALNGKGFFESAAERTRYKDLCKFLRWVLLGGADGPGVVATLLILGRSESRRRLSIVLPDI